MHETLVNVQRYVLTLEQRVRQLELASSRKDIVLKSLRTGTPLPDPPPLLERFRRDGAIVLSTPTDVEDALETFRSGAWPDPPRDKELRIEMWNKLPYVESLCELLSLAGSLAPKVILSREVGEINTTEVPREYFSRLAQASTSLTQLTLGLGIVTNSGLLAFVAKAGPLPGLTQLSLHGNGLDDAPLSALFALNFPALEELNLSGNLMGEQAARVLASSLGRFSNLRVLTLDHNRIECNGIRALASAIKTFRHCSIKALDVSFNRFGTGALSALMEMAVLRLEILRLCGLQLGQRHQEVDLIARALAFPGSGLKLVNLSMNMIDDAGVANLVQTLQYTKNTPKIMLNWNRIEDSGAAVVAMALERGWDVRGLELEENRMTATGLKRLARAVAHPNSRVQYLVCGLDDTPENERVLSTGSNRLAPDVVEMAIRFWSSNWQQVGKSLLVLRFPRVPMRLRKLPSELLKMVWEMLARGWYDIDQDAFESHRSDEDELDRDEFDEFLDRQEEREGAFVRVGVRENALSATARVINDSLERVVTRFELMQPDYDEDE
jgi:Ran GTPase-activating protein (RanGAP) involved in mRNA processing and transport